MQERTKILLVFLSAAAAVGAMGDAAMFQLRAQRLEKQLAEFKKNPQIAAQEETQELLNKVGMLIVLPQGEQPIVATVSDPEKLQSQAFFSSAKKGDKVLIYTNAKKAILYDPVADKILEVAPVNIGASSAPNTAPPSTP